MIYTQLKTIARWHMWLTPVLFLLYAGAGGALLAGQAKLAGVLILAVTAAQLLAWKQGDEKSTTGDLGTATGLGEIGQVRLLESAHTARNYILDEMAFQVGRKHVDKLRMISVACIGLFPAILLLALPAGHLTALVAMILHVIGVAASRWLFFAQAEHVVASYYGR
jgi:DMSO reductase anchor subunit